MVAKPTRRRATYQDVLDAPEHMVAEVIDGELSLMPRPKRRHTRNATGLGAILVTAFDYGLHGPGGWTILAEPELHLGLDILVPDIAGWRAGRLIDDPDVDEPFITVVPDWVCEVLSIGTRRIDRLKKMPIYAREKVGHVWLADPEEQTVEVFRFDGLGYRLVGTYGGDDPIRAEPFDAVEIAPAYFWGRPAAPAPAPSATKSAKPKRARAKTARRR